MRPAVTAAPLVMKLGGELLEDPSRLEGVVAAITRIARTGGPTRGGATGESSGRASGEWVQPGMPLVIVHGGGKEIDAALMAAGIEKRQVDGLRITDDATLDVVVSVLAGAVNTRFVAALTTAGVAAVGLTGADGPCGLCEASPPHRSVDGRTVDLGRVGIPGDQADLGPITTLIGGGFVPVIASIGLARDGRLFNVNADTFAGHVAAALGAQRLVIAGTTAGVLDHAGSTVPVIEPATMERLIAGGTARAGMIAKLRACEHAVANGVDVVIVDGGNRSALEAAALGGAPPGTTRIVGASLKSCAATE
jgi:acetylglutamate kinase